jgi:threonine/homoserine/homoserine lactone efflux protein
LDLMCPARDAWFMNEMTMTILAAAGAYAVAAALLTMLPGPDTAIVIATAVNGGRRAAVRAAFGIAVGLLFWGAAASFGIAALLRASAEVYTGFRIVCVAYLLWLAFGALRSAFRRRREGQPAAEGAEPHGRRLRLPWGFRQALLTAVLNPKLGVFFVVFLPQFIPEGTPAMTMTLLFGAIQAAEALVWYLFIGSLAAVARQLLSRPRVRRVMDAVTGAIFVFFGARLALDA